jgi:hypothetical protein
MGRHIMARAQSRSRLQHANRRPVDEAAVRVALGQLGDNTLTLGALDLSDLDLAAGGVREESNVKCYPRPCYDRMFSTDRAWDCSVDWHVCCCCCRTIVHRVILSHSLLFTLPNDA